MMEALQMASLLRRIRHDFANHLQVISGYLEMGWESQLSDYVRNITAVLNQERIAFEAVGPEAALYFYEQLLMIKDMGIILIYEDLEIASVQVLQANHEPFNSIAAMRPEIPVGDDEPVLYLSIHEDETHIDMFFSSDMWREESRQISIIKE
ncbi:MAG TPA: Spo0B domain-containing protein [Syntrophomonas sp.]|nr:Spo0B domain-containing protein [Syntrophomonas sp.]